MLPPGQQRARKWLLTLSKAENTYRQGTQSRKILREKSYVLTYILSTVYDSEQGSLCNRLASHPSRPSTFFFLLYICHSLIKTSTAENKWLWEKCVLLRRLKMEMKMKSPEVKYHAQVQDWGMRREPWQGSCSCYSSVALKETSLPFTPESPRPPESPLKPSSRTSRGGL